MEKKASTSQACGMKFVGLGLILCLSALSLGTLSGCDDSNIVATQAKSASPETGATEATSTGSLAENDSGKSDDSEDAVNASLGGAE